MLKRYTIKTERRGLYNITSYVRQAVTESGVQEGIAVIFCPHTTAAITINENADPDVQADLEAIFNRLVKEREPYYRHTCEGDDDMPAHAKCTLTGTGLTIPVTNHRLNMGIWQGIYLCEFRNGRERRKIVATVIGE